MKQKIKKSKNMKMKKKNWKNFKKKLNIKLKI